MKGVKSTTSVLYFKVQIMSIIIVGWPRLNVSLSTNMMCAGTRKSSDSGKNHLEADILISKMYTFIEGKTMRFSRLFNHQLFTLFPVLPT